MSRIDAWSGAVASGLAIGERRAWARRSHEPVGSGLRYFRGGEPVLVDVLADLVIPSEESNPGARDLARAGRPILRTLDRLIASSPARQVQYARGLVALNRAARRSGDLDFVALPRDQQLSLLDRLDQLARSWSRPISFTAKITTRLAMLRHRSTGLFWAAELFPILVADIMRAFYTDQVSWTWLGYDGPPMPLGYPELHARLPAAQTSRGNPRGAQRVRTP